MMIQPFLLGEGGPLTICLAVKVFDCLVFAADSATSIVQTDPNGNQVITRVYEHGCKVFNLCRGLPVCGMTSGLGNIGLASISSVAKDLRRLLEGDNPAWAINPENYTIEEIAIKARQYIFDERITAANINVGNASLNFWVGGYGSGSDHAEVWSIVVENGTCPAPVQSLDGVTCGWQCSGQPEALNRLLLGYSQRLPELLASAGVDANASQQALAALGSDPNTQLVEASMPTQDAINLTDFLVETVKGYVRFLPGPDVVGGDTDMAVVTKHEHFKWIKRKHYYPPHLNLETDHG
jgi:hypothetical protein